MKELIKIQSELKAPKGQYNQFGNYKYRSCEDILEAVKPLLEKYKCSIVILDDIKLIGDRYYIEAKVSLYNEEGTCIAQSKAFARESAIKKGMDESQITGAASSYARKYALNGLFAIDDTKDADTQDNTIKEKNNPVATQNKQHKPSVKDAKFSVPIDDAAKYVMKTNKNLKGTQLGNIPKNILHGYIAFIDGLNKEITGIMLEDYNAMKAYLKADEQNSNKFRDCIVHKIHDQKSIVDTVDDNEQLNIVPEFTTDDIPF